MSVSVALIRKITEIEEPQLRDILLAILEEMERQRAQWEESITRREFLEFGKKMEESFRQVWNSINELTQAQKRTEERVEELAQAQKRTEERVEELAEAQKRTEKRVEELAEAQQESERRLTRLEKAVEDLAQAQKRTEEELQKLIKEHKETRSQLGGLAMTVGYRLEDEAFKALPRLLREDYKIEVKGRLKRQYVADRDGRLLEVNIFGHATKEGKPVVIIGEGKSQLSAKDINRFIQGKLKRFEGVFDDIFPVMVTYMISSPDVEDYANKKGIALYYSYDF